VTLRAIADTHSVIWYLYDDPRLSPAARATASKNASISSPSTRSK
jgi:PIN domain nuclease of toxin-antitoxin system